MQLEDAALRQQKFDNAQGTFNSVDSFLKRVLPKPDHLIEQGLFAKDIFVSHDNRNPTKEEVLMVVKNMAAVGLIDHASVEKHADELFEYRNNDWGRHILNNLQKQVNLAAANKTNDGAPPRELSKAARQQQIKQDEHYAKLLNKTEEATHISGISADVVKAISGSYKLLDAYENKYVTAKSVLFGAKNSLAIEEKRLNDTIDTTEHTDLSQLTELTKKWLKANRNFVVIDKIYKFIYESFDKWDLELINLDKKKTELPNIDNLGQCWDDKGHPIVYVRELQAPSVLGRQPKRRKKKN